MNRPHSLLILSHDVVGSQMAGPGIRYYHLARVLACELPVTLAVPGNSTNDSTTDLALPGVTFASYQPHAWASIGPLIAQASIVLLPSEFVARFPQVSGVDATLIIDGYNPILAEWLATHADHASEDLRPQWQSRLEQQAATLRVGDFFICASERQRDWWLGQLEASGRINPATYQADPTLRQLIDVVPYGLPADLPVATKPVIKGVWPGIAPTDKVVLWGGGLWPWLDPLTAIHAIHQLAATRPEIKLIFPGTKHPNPDMAEMRTHRQAAQALAASLDLTDRSVFFGDWVAYADWPNVLLESDVALTLHADSIETRLAFRSRVLEYVWAGLPTVATMGDATSDLIAEYGLGIQVAAHDAAQVAAAIVQLVDEPRSKRAPAFDQARTQLNWERAVAPLAAFCRSPRRAADREDGQGWLPPLEQRQHKIERLQAEVLLLRDLVTRYEQGRFMRLMRSVARLQHNFMGKFMGRR